MNRFFALLGNVWEVLARRVDNVLMGTALAIVGVGLVTLFSASDQSVPRVMTQALSLTCALVLMWIVANVAPRQLARATLATIHIRTSAQVSESACVMTRGTL